MPQADLSGPGDALGFDFDAAVTAPFRMQPGLRRLAAAATHLHPLAPGGRHMREKLAVLSAYADEALLTVPGFDALQPLGAVAALAAAEHPTHWHWDGRTAAAARLGCAVHAASGRLTQRAAGAFGLGDEVSRCLAALPADQRLAGLLSLTFAEDLALLDGRSGTLPWLAVALPSHWAPQHKIGRHFSAVHTPVADNQLLLGAAEALLRTVTGGQRWERFVWTITPHPRLHAHPARVAPEGWAAQLGPGATVQPKFDPHQAWFRSERQTFAPLPPPPAAAADDAQGQALALFTIGVQLQPLADVASDPARAARLHAALASMSQSVLAYRGLQPVQRALLDWLQRQAQGA